jgi:exodeoxyribonuclease-5
MKKIRQDSLKWNRKYIFVGDPYQLPPIGETHSPAFGVGSSFTLEEVVRQERGSKIIQFATYTRDCIQKDVPVELPDDLLQVVRGKNFTKVVLDHYANQVSSEDTRFLAYTNARVFEANQAIETLRGDPKGGSYVEGQPFREGDIVKVNEAYVLDEEVLYPTGEEVKVTAIYPCVKLPPWARGLDAWSVAIESRGAKDSVTVLDNACKSMLSVALERKASQCRRDGKWGEFYDMQEFFIDLRPRHAMTVHKSQGSTFDKVFIDYRNILKNRNVREADRMLYVAVTRAKHEVIIGI